MDIFYAPTQKMLLVSAFIFADYPGPLEGLEAADDLPSDAGVSAGLHQIVFAVFETPEPIRHLPAPMMNSEVGDEDEECGGGV